MPKLVRMRMKEPSTWAGIATIAITVAQLVPATAPVAHSLASLFGALAIVMRENA